MANELHHYLFELSLSHLPVADDDAGVRDKLMNLVGHLDNAVDAVVHEIDLPLALKLAHDGQLDPLLVEGDDFGDDAAAVLGGGGERADVAEAQHAHVQGSW